MGLKIIARYTINGNRTILYLQNGDGEVFPVTTDPLPTKTIEHRLRNIPVVGGLGEARLLAETEEQTT